MVFVFDIGGVLLSFDPPQYLDSVFGERKENKLLFETIFRSPEWIMLDKGTITLTEACEVFSSRLPEMKQDVLFVMDNWEEMMTRIPQTIELLRKISETHDTYYLSNMHEHTTRYILSNNDFCDCFKGGVFSCTVGHIKPDIRIYEYFLSSYNLKASDCVFIDDMQDNINAAKKIGMQGIVAQSPAQLAEEIKQYL